MLTNVFTKTMRDRWKGEAIAAVTIAVLLFLGMSTYRDIDLAVYTGLPEALRALMNIPQDADVASIAYGAIYSSYGALTLAALSLSMGAASIAGEEKKGTLGLLLANPRSRTRVLIAKTASMVLLTGMGAFVLWGAGRIAPPILDVDVTGMEVGAFVFHMFIVAIFFGFLATAIGAWTGNSGLAVGPRPG